jgi:hypothetical protein
MSPPDHNKTLIVLYSLLSGVFLLPLLGSPWIIAKNVKNPEQVPMTIAIAAAVLLLATLFLLTALMLYRRRAIGRKLAIVVAVLLLPLCWPLGVYTWWFMHSEGGKEMYCAVD